jgi:UDP-glucose 4-epimerase
LKFAKINNSKIIYAGSSTKFGDIGKESSPYAFTKATNTEFVKNYCEWFNLEYAITYFYNAYGPREIETGKYATLIAKFKKLYNQKKPLPIVLPGTQQRNFTHVKDIVNGLYLVGLRGKGDGYGIGSDKVFSVQEVANLISNNQIFLPSRPGNRNNAELKTSKTISLGWKPKKNLEAYIKKELENNKL